MEVDNENILSDEQLIAGCIADDKKCQELLYRKYADKMYGVCLTYVNDEDSACDILHDGFLKVFRGIHTFQHQGSFEGWIRKIIVNTALELHRRKNREKEVFELYQTYIEPKIDGILDKINTADIIKLVNQLPSKAAMVLKLYSIEGYSHKEIAGMMEITEGTSKSQLNRARFLLKEAMHQQNGRE